MTRKVVIVGGHGNVSLRLARLISPSREVTSTIRDESQAPDITATGATPLVISLEHDDTTKWAAAFEGAEVVYFSAGAGGKGGPERTKAVDYEGAVKVFDAVERVSGPKPRLVLVSAVDVRHPDRIPAHYNDEDKAASERMRKALTVYMHWKYQADCDLAKRTAFKWTILRPGSLTNDPGTGKAAIGRTHITRAISRDDVAKVLALLADRPDASGLALDFVGGEEEIENALDEAIKKGESDFDG